MKKQITELNIKLMEKILNVKIISHYIGKLLIR